MSKEENYSNHSDSFTSLFSMTMPIMTTDTTSVEEQLIDMARVIAKLNKMVEEKVSCLFDEIINYSMVEGSSLILLSSI